MAIDIQVIKDGRIINREDSWISVPECRHLVFGVGNLPALLPHCHPTLVLFLLHGMNLRLQASFLFKGEKRKFVSVVPLAPLIGFVPIYFTEKW